MQPGHDQDTTPRLQADVRLVEASPETHSQTVALGTCVAKPSGWRFSAQGGSSNGNSVGRPVGASTDWAWSFPAKKTAQSNRSSPQSCHEQSSGEPNSGPFTFWILAPGIWNARGPKESADEVWFGGVRGD